MGVRRQAPAPRFAVTGATGWLGRGVLEHLLGVLGERAFRQRVRGFASRDREVVLTTGLATSVQSIGNLPAYPHDVLVHLAFLTRDRVTDLGLDAYVCANLEITGIVAESVSRQRPRALVYASSGAVYEEDGSLAHDVRSNPYGTAKHLDELVFRQLACDFDARCVVARVFNVGGPWMTNPQGYALGDLILQALAGGPLSVRAREPAVRSYIDVSDLAELVVRAALDDSAPNEVIFDTVGSEQVEVGELAERIVRALSIDTAIERTWDPASRADVYVGDPRAQEDLCDRLEVSLRSLDIQIERTAASLRLAGQHSAVGGR